MPCARQLGSRKIEASKASFFDGSRAGGGRRRPLSGAVFFFVGILVCQLGMACLPAAARTAPDRDVRVLLYEGSGPARLTVSQGSPVKRVVKKVRIKGQGLEMNGRFAGRDLLLTSDQPIGWAGKHYRGQIRVRWSSAGMQIINEVSLDEYVAGTLFREAYSSWKLEALYAQSIVARTYALAQMEKSAAAPYDLRSDTASQVYGGVDAERARALSIVRKTSGEYLSYLGKPILAAYHANAGGQTASAAEVWGREMPYLVSLSIEDEWESPDAYWRLERSPKELSRALEAAGFTVGRVKQVEIAKRTPSGRVAKIQFHGTRRIVEISGKELRELLGSTVLRSTLFEVQPTEKGDFIFVGSGYGHGVGMSQWGAQSMAEDGKGYQAILAHFYPGTSLHRPLRRTGQEPIPPASQTGNP